jgi:hypothetical protein
VVMEAIRAAKVSLPDWVDRGLAQIIRKALEPDLDSRYRTAGEFAGELFTWLLDSGHSPSRHTAKDWLVQTLGHAGL